MDIPSSTRSSRLLPVSMNLRWELILLNSSLPSLNVLPLSTFFNHPNHDWSTYPYELKTDLWLVVPPPTTLALGTGLGSVAQDL